jgi:hypothetical protein
LSAVRLLILSLLAVSSAFGQDTLDYDRPSLKGIGRIFVAVDIDKDIQGAGLDSGGVKADVKLKLRRAGIPLLETNADLEKAPGGPYLLVTVDSIRSEATRSFYASIGLNQNIVLARDPSIKKAGEFSGRALTAETWRTNPVMWIGLGNPTEVARQAIKDLTDKFINAYLAENPKK